MADDKERDFKYGKEDVAFGLYINDKLARPGMNLIKDVETLQKIKKGIGVKLRKSREKQSYRVFDTFLYASLRQNNALSDSIIQQANRLRIALKWSINDEIIENLQKLSKLMSYWNEQKKETIKNSEDMNAYINEYSNNINYSPSIILKNFQHEPYLNIYLLKQKSADSLDTKNLGENDSINKYAENIQKEAKIGCAKLEAKYNADEGAKPRLKETVKGDDTCMMRALVAGHFKDAEKEIPGKHLNEKLGCPKSKWTDGEDVEDDIIDYLNTAVRRRDFPLQPVEITVFMQPSSHPYHLFGIPWNMLKREINRILTFARYPKDAVKSALLLAAQGFVYIGTGQGSDDQVKCCFCCGEKRNWGILDVIQEVHRRISPNCSMVTGVDCDNDPISTTSYLSHPANPLNTSELIASNNNGELCDNLQTDSVLDAAQPSIHVTPREFQGRKTPNNQDDRRNPTAGNTTMLNYPPGHTDHFSVTPPGNNFVQLDPQVRPASVPTRSTLAPQVLVETASRTQTPRNDLNAPMSDNPQRTQVHISNASRPSSNLASDLNESQITTMPTTVPQGATAAEITTPTVQTPPPASATNKPDENPNNPNGQQGTAHSVQTGSPGSGSNNTGSNKAPTYSELGIITERPKRTEYARKEARAATFECWPRDHHLSPDELAEAGFYYAGYGDCARCFYCGGGLRNWEDEDNVFVEHARWFPKCAFIRQQRGQFFVDTVQELNKSYTAIPLERVLAITGASAFPTLATKDLQLKKDPAVITVQQLGYDEEDVLQAAQLVKDEFTIVSSDAILERLDRDGKKKVHPANTLLPVSSSSRTADLERIQQLKEKNNQLRQQTVCKICMDKEVAVVFLPCGHLVSCADCASAMKDCPYCRKPIKGIVRAFIS